ncbi:hypothetical protein [Capnocytophaga endodontalis]|uniref:Lipoprotein n=1 Tax=Capnocytophaga endodontalis TaxID=2708117 RepID=A0A1Z4BSQ0_9FLAO|nr:hypothetical protein [Capnocytophaga endodontalis]ASF44335.1 hypothetical protein CBG49_15210 [Capnocytophaga endodontalis]
MIRKIIYLFFLIGILISCDFINNQNKQEEELDCEGIISKIVQSSSLDWKHYPKVSTRIDRISGDSIFIKVFFDMDITDENEPNTQQVVENAVAWLLLCVKEKKLYNITYDIENPIILTFDENLLTADNIEKICKESNENKIISESESSNHIKIKKNLVDKRYEGKWECFKYIKDSGNDNENEIFNEKYAEQFSHFAQFSLKKDSLLVPKGCSKYVFQYKYPTKSKRNNEEDSYIIFFKPKQDSISFIKGIEDDLECNDIFNRLFLNDTTIIFRDRGYFFYFKKKYKDDFASKNFHIEGIPGDDRNYWKVEKEYNFSNLQEAYNCFLTDFPYGSENLLNKIPLKSFYDNKHYINYTIQKNNIIIEKEVPLGIVSISLKKKNNVWLLSYEIKYPQE